MTLFESTENCEGVHGEEASLIGFSGAVLRARTVLVEMLSLSRLNKTYLPSLERSKSSPSAIFRVTFAVSSCSKKAEWKTTESGFFLTVSLRNELKRIDFPSVDHRAGGQPLRV